MTVNRLKVMTVVGTRPEIIRLSRVLPALDKYMDHVLVHTGQNYDYELNQVFFEDLDLRKPDHFLEAAGATAAETIGAIIARMDPLLAQLKPGALLVLGDTNSCLAAIPAKRRKVPVFHMEAGNRCFDQRVPEEINRVIVDHISDINLPYSDISREYLLREGLPPDRVIKTGSPMFEVLHHYMPKIQGSDVVRRLGLTEGAYFVVSAHREENIDPPQQFARLVALLRGLAGKFRTPIILTTHPRTRKRLNEEGVELPSIVQTHRPFCLTDYVKLQLGAKAVLSDSGTVSEEASILDLPALNIRDAHERPEAMEEAAALLTGLDFDRVLQGLFLLEKQSNRGQRLFPVVRDYNVPAVSEKVARIILSYTGYVNRTVWAQ